MDLASCIDDVDRRTRELGAVLQAGDLAAIAPALAARADALQAFERAHRAADGETRRGLQDRLRSLQRADRELQDLAAAALRDADRTCREALGANSADNRSYRDEPALACLDRRA